MSILVSYACAAVAGALWFYTAYHFRLSRAAVWRGFGAIMVGWLVLVVVG